jgi:hypothetical protein
MKSGARFARFLQFCIGSLIAETHCFGTWPIGLWMLMQRADGSWHESSFAFLFAIMGGQLSVVAGTFVGVVHRRETLYRREWAALELDAA